MQGCRAQQAWPLWEGYTQHFLDGQGRVIDRSAGDRTTSEGQAYALFFSLVDNDRPHFDKLLNWTEANLAEGDLTLHLPAWDWGHTDSGEWKIRDANSAADADLWLAYTLIEAGRLWHEPRYGKLGILVAQRIAHSEVAAVPGVGIMLLPGPSGFRVEAPPAVDGGATSATWILNPSYLPLPVLAELAHELPDGPWAAIITSLPSITGGAASHGFAMDWVAAGPGGVHPVAPPREPSAGRRETQAAGSYDAVRVYLWLGMTDPGTRGAHQLMEQVSGMGTYLHIAPTPPLEVAADGTVLRTDGPPGFSAAVVPYLQAAGLKAEMKQQADRLTATADTGSGLYGHSPAYYDQNLALFSTGWSEGRFRFERSGRLYVRWK